MRKLALVVFALLVVLAGSAQARPYHTAGAVKVTPSMCERAAHARHKVIRLHGHRAPGRDICRFGVVRHGKTRPANHHERARYFRELRLLGRPAPRYLSRAAVPPRQGPAGTLSSGYSPTGVAACIVSRESGGNPRANNGSHFGIAQWSNEAWARMGGLRYASRADYASYQDQLRVLSDGLARYGTADWHTWDGC